MCGQAVSYPFFLRHNQTLMDLDHKALSRLPNSMSGLLPSSCASSILRMVCALVYKKCSHSMMMSNITTWNYAVYDELSVPYPVPFQRPCRSVCTRISRECEGWWRLFTGTAIDCNERYDYSDGQLGMPFPLALDPSNNETICNDIFTNVSLSEAVEPYQGSLCSAFLSGSIIIPSGSRFGISPWQPPFVVQSLLESELVNTMQSVKLFLKPTCYTALLKMVCASLFRVPRVQTVNGSLSAVVVSDLASFVGTIGLHMSDVLAYKLYEPALPVVDVCLAYYSVCSLYPALKSNMSLLTPDCSRRPPPSVENDPSLPRPNHTDFNVGSSLDDSVVLWASDSTALKMRRVSLHWQLHWNNSQVLCLVTKSEPNTYNEEPVLAYEPKCPKGFVVPEHPANPGIIWVEDTACAFSCVR